MSDEKKKSEGTGVNPLVGVALALIVAGAGGTYYFYNQYQQSQRQLQEVRAAEGNQDQVVVQEVAAKVGQLMELPADETPTVATIRDAEKLKDHPFLAKGQVGDQLLIYTGAKVVVMYRPSSNKIVAVGTVTIQQAGEAAGQAETEE